MWIGNQQDDIPLLPTEFNDGPHPGRPVRPPGPDDQNPNARPIIPTTQPTTPEPNDEWDHPDQPKTTRRPPSWGPPRAPGSKLHSFRCIAFD